MMCGKVSSEQILETLLLVLVLFVVVVVLVMC